MGRFWFIPLISVGQIGWTRITSLPDGLSGTAHTLDAMAQLVRSDAHSATLRHLASNIVSSCTGHAFGCEVRRLFEFVRDHITFRKDPVDQERVQDSDTTLRTRVGDCDDKCVLLASLLGALGHRARFVVIGESPQRFSHVFITVQTPRGWLSLDPTPERAPAGWEAHMAHRWVYPIWPRRRF